MMAWCNRINEKKKRNVGVIVFKKTRQMSKRTEHINREELYYLKKEEEPIEIH